jgi:hypothetical protein
MAAQPGMLLKRTTDVPEEAAPAGPPVATRSGRRSVAPTRHGDASAVEYAEAMRDVTRQERRKQRAADDSTGVITSITGFRRDPVLGMLAVCEWAPKGARTYKPTEEPVYFLYQQEAQRRTLLDAIQRHNRTARGHQRVTTEDCTVPYQQR